MLLFTTVTLAPTVCQTYPISLHHQVLTTPQTGPWTKAIYRSPTLSLPCSSPRLMAVPGSLLLDMSTMAPSLPHVCLFFLFIFQLPNMTSICLFSEDRPLGRRSDSIHHDEQREG